MPASVPNDVRDGDGPGQASLSELVRASFAEALGIEAVGLDDHFFDRGGHSLSAMQAAARIEERTDLSVPVSALFDHPTPRALAAALAAHPTSNARQRSPSSAPTAASGTLSPAERGVWFLEQAMGRRSAYLLSNAWDLHGPLDVEALRQALEAVVARHPALSMRFDSVSGEPRVLAAGAAPVRLTLHDLGGLSAEERDASVARYVTDDTTRPFELGGDCLIRATLLRLADAHHVLQITVHHIVSDATSQQLLLRDLAEFYAACRAGATPLPSAEPAVRPASPDAARMAALRAYWTRQLASLPLLQLPIDKRRQLAWSDAGAELEFDVPASLTVRLYTLAAEHGVTLQMLLVTAYAVLLGRYSGQTDFAVATFASDRRSPEEQRAIGLFVNTVLLRADLSGAPTLRDVIGRVRRTSLDAYDHRDYPFDALVSDLRPHRQHGPNPLTPAAFQFLPMSDDPPALDGLTVTRRACPMGHTRFDLEFTARPYEAGLRVLVGYSTDLFEHDTIARLAGAYSTVLACMADAPDSTVAEVAALTPADREEQLERWSGARVAGHCAVVNDLFDARVTAAPDAIAIVSGTQRVTYRELDAHAGRIAAQLTAAGVTPGQTVAVHAERSIALVAATLGVLKVGAVYLPLDPSHPAERLAYLMRDAHATALVADADAPDVVRAAVSVVSPFPGEDARIAPAARPPLTPDSPAYVMYTSGSTGQPKGVSVPHRAVTRLVCDTNFVRFGADDGVAFVSNPAFDAATLEIWGALLNGGRLVLLDRDTLLSPARLEAALVAGGVTVMFLTAALFRRIAAVAPGTFSPLRVLIVGGDVVDPAAASAVLTSAAPGRLVNGYGPTENTTFSTTADIAGAIERDRTIPIGRPIAGSTCFVLNSCRALLPVGASGELYVGGSGLALGYVNQLALTADRFVDHPFSAGERLYRTGDLVRWRADGQLEFLGRLDRQVKIRGHRVELEEIEHVLGLHHAVTTCAVTSERAPDGDIRLVAYAAGVPGRIPVEDDIRRHLQQRLPSYMVPERIVATETLPLTPNGKIDRAALATRGNAPADHAARATRGTGAPQTPLEATVATAFCEALDLPSVDRDDGFFDVGGDSLSALRLADLLSRSLGRSVAASEIFAHPTVAGLSAALGQAPVEPSSRIVEIRRGGTRAPVYFPPGVLGEVMLSDDIRRALPDDLPLYALRDVIDEEPRAPSMEAMAARFAAAITAFQPEGPLCLAGYSFGGLLAYEMARQLKAAGREIRLLAIFDTGPDFSRGGSLGQLAVRVWLCLQNLPRWIGEDVIRSFGPDTPARLWRSVRKLVGSIVRPSFHAAATPGTFAKVEHLFDTSTWSPALYAHVENNLRIIGAFRYRPYDGQVTLFRARVRPLFHALTWDLGWQVVAPDVRVIETPGNHHTLMYAPHVHVLARKLREELEG